MTADSALVDAAICKAFTILFAYIIQEFYYQVVIDNAYTPPFDADQVLAVRVSWFAIVMILCPLLVRSARGLNPPGAKAHSFWQNIKSLWGASIMMIVGWAFKDVCHAFTVLYTPPQNCYERIWSSDANDYVSNPACDAKSFGYRWQYFGYAMAIAAAGICLNFFSRSGVGGLIDKIFDAEEYNAMSHEDKRKEGSFRQIMVEYSGKFRAARPLSLGIGLLCNQAMEAPWDWFMFYAIKYDNDGTSRPYDEGTFNFRWSVFLLVRNVANTYLVVMLHLWFNKRTDAYGKEWESLTLGRFRWGLTDTLVFSTKFNLAWSWADFIQFQFYTILFQCHIPFTHCGDYGIWLRGYYAVGLTGLMILVVPILKKKQNLMGSLKGAYSSQILKNDRLALDNEVVYNELYNAMFGIMVGWGWTGLLATACLSGYTFTCPDNYSVKRTFLFAANSMFYVFLACGAYHFYMEGSRMSKRAAKVHLLEKGKATEFFGEADADSSGTIDKEEMKTFVDSYGFEKECFELAFDRADKIKGADGDEEVYLYKLVDQFEVVVKEEYKKEKALKKRCNFGETTQTTNPLSPKSKSDGGQGASVELRHQEPKASPGEESHETAKMTLKGAMEGSNVTMSSNTDGKGVRSPSPPKRDDLM